MAEQHASRLECVRVAVGELTAIEPDLLRFAWEATVAGGPDAESRLEVEWHAARQHCAKCGQQDEQADRSWLAICLNCGEPLIVEGGRELDLLQVSFLRDD